MEHKVESFEIFGKTEMLVGFDFATKQYVITEECYGFHNLIDEELKIRLTSVEIVIAGKGVDILPLLNRKQRQEIIDNLPL